MSQSVFLSTNPNTQRVTVVTRDLVFIISGHTNNYLHTKDPNPGRLQERHWIPVMTDVTGHTEPRTHGEVGQRTVGEEGSTGRLL